MIMKDGPESRALVAERIAKLKKGERIAPKAPAVAATFWSPPAFSSSSRPS